MRLHGFNCTLTDIFISYKRENLAAVQRVVTGLRGAGLAVWWDQDIAPDAQWEAAIERELNAAKVVIVVWSQASVASENVKAEARRARGQGKLIQVFVEACEPPLFFGERQGVDLSGWNGDASDGRFQAVLAAARAIIAGKRPPEGVGYAPRQRRPWAAALATLAAASVVLGFLANLGGARDMLCGFNGLRQTCRDWGIVGAEAADPAVLAAETRQRLLAGVVGAWGRQDRDCANTVNYRLARGEDGFDRITATAPGFESVSQVIAAENGVVVARATAASATVRRSARLVPYKSATV